MACAELLAIGCCSFCSMAGVLPSAPGLLKARTFEVRCLFPEASFCNMHDAACTELPGHCCSVADVRATAPLVSRRPRQCGCEFRKQPWQFTRCGVHRSLGNSCRSPCCMAGAQPSSPGIVGTVGMIASTISGYTYQFCTELNALRGIACTSLLQGIVSEGLRVNSALRRFALTSFAAN